MDNRDTPEQQAINGEEWLNPSNWGGTGMMAGSTYCSKRDSRLFVRSRWRGGITKITLNRGHPKAAIAQAIALFISILAFAALVGMSFYFRAG